MTENPVPTSIRADKTQRNLTVLWNDGHTSEYSFSLLRAGCPCASCRGGHENMGTEPGHEVFSVIPSDLPATRLQKVEAVGSYAVMFTWEDGHHYGIYNWHYLRALCPCPVCRSIGN
jgi:DUF971 family protein